MLETERQFFEENRAKWAEAHPDKFVVVNGREALGFFDTREDALVAGVRQVGLQSFLVRSVSEPEAEVRIPAMTAGVLGADPTSAV